jgi:hypothetical protein
MTFIMLTPKQKMVILKLRGVGFIKIWIVALRSAARPSIEPSAIAHKHLLNSGEHHAASL